MQRKSACRLTQDVEDDYVFIEPNTSTPLANNEEFIFVNWYEISTGAYTPSKVDAILQKQFAETLTGETAIFYDKNASVYARIYHRDNQRIILFNVVKDYQGGGEYQLRDVEWVLEKFKATHTFIPTDILIIPIAELMRKHFRLLTIHNNIIDYFDSKPMFVSVPSRVQGALLASAQVVADDMSEDFTDVCPHIHSTDSIYTKAEKSVTAVASLAYQFGIYAYQTVINAPEYFDPVKQICLRQFPGMPFRELAMGVQSVTDHVNCGPFTIAYAEQIVADKSLDQILDPQTLRAAFEM